MNDIKQVATSKQQTQTLLKLTILHRFSIYLLLLLSSNLQRNFDTSPNLQLLTSFSSNSTFSSIIKILIQPLLRWDGLHFLGVSSPIPLPIPPSTLSEKVSIPPSFGYSSESNLAWQSGLEWLLRTNGLILNFISEGFHEGNEKNLELKWNPIHSIFLTSFEAGLTSLFSPILLYHLTLKQTSSQRFSFLTASLSILSPSPTTLITPSPESFFSFFALLGFYLLTSSSTRFQHREINLYDWVRLLLASLSFSIAALFRANGILLAGFVWWKFGWEWSSTTSSSSRSFSILLRILALPFLTLLIWTPFLSSQRWVYVKFCSEFSNLELSSTIRPWCKHKIPSIYSFVQDHYWNVGFLRYWTLSQLPNFLLASPVLFLASFSCWNYYKSDFKSIILKTLLPWTSSFETKDHSSNSIEKKKNSKGFSSSISKEEARENVETKTKSSKQSFSDQSTSNISSPNHDSDSNLDSSKSNPESQLSFRSSPKLLPHIHFTFLTLLILIFNSHTQIALRFSTPGGLPAVWWGFSLILIREEKNRKKNSNRWKSNLLVGWLVFWNVISVVLNGGFYPPA